MNRRTAISGLCQLAAAGFARNAAGSQATAVQTPPAQTPPDQSPRFGLSAPKRTAPMLCVYSQNMVRIPYPQLGDIVSQMGFEGVDLTVMIGGHVDPRVTNVDLVRAFESIRGAGLEVPMISTNIISTTDTTTYPVLYLTGHSQVPLFRLGYWQYGNSPAEITRRLTQVRQDISQIVAVGQRCGITAMFPNRAGGYVGQSTWDTQLILEGIDPHWVGYEFDPAEATAEGGGGGWEAALRLALPRLHAISLQDFVWKKDGDAWKMEKCPLGQGMVDWEKFFTMVAAASFTGPLSIRVDYNPQDAPGAMSKDLEFARDHVKKAWSETQHDKSKS